VTNFRLFPSTNGPAVSAASGGWLLGVLFSVTGGVKWLTGYWLWAPTGGDTTARNCALWNQYWNGTAFTNVLVPGSVVASSGTLTLNAWNFVPLSSPIQLAPGGLYVAASGWTATNGIPVLAAQWGTGDPLAAGIVNGPLTAWSATSGSNTWPGQTVNGGLGQNLFSNVLGSNASAAMPNNGSGDDSLGMDLQISDTAPAGFAGTYRFKPNISELGNYNLDTANGFTLGMSFSSTTGLSVSKVWFYSPATVTQLPTAVGVFNASNQVLVLSNLAPSWSGAAGSGWISATLTGLLSAGVTYKVCVFQGANVIWNAAVAGYWTTGGFGANGITAGPMTAPNTTGAPSPGQSSYNTSTTGIAFPNTNIGPFDYGVDIEATPLAASGAGGSGQGESMAGLYRKLRILHMAR